MEIFRFLKWWWYSIDIVHRTGISIVTTVAVFSFMLVVLLSKFGVIVIWCMLAVGVLMLLASAARYSYNVWQKYKAHREKEMDKVVDRLKGTTTRIYADD